MMEWEIFSSLTRVKTVTAGNFRKLGEDLFRHLLSEGIRNLSCYDIS